MVLLESGIDRLADAKRGGVSNEEKAGSRLGQVRADWLQRGGRGWGGGGE